MLYEKLRQALYRGPGGGLSNLCSHRDIEKTGRSPEFGLAAVPILSHRTVDSASSSVQYCAVEAGVRPIHWKRRSPVTNVSKLMNNSLSSDLLVFCFLATANMPDRIWPGVTGEEPAGSAYAYYLGYVLDPARKFSTAGCIL